MGTGVNFGTGGKNRSMLITFDFRFWLICGDKPLIKRYGWKSKRMSQVKQILKLLKQGHGNRTHCPQFRYLAEMA